MPNVFYVKLLQYYQMVIVFTLPLTVPAIPKRVEFVLTVIQVTILKTLIANSYLKDVSELITFLLAYNV